MPVFGFGHETCTSTTRPASPSLGQLIYQTDTDEYLKYVTDIDGTNRWMQAVYKPNRRINLNGDFRIWQRGTTRASAGSGITTFAADRYCFGNNNTAQYVATQQATGPRGDLLYAMRIAANATVTNGLNGVEHLIETADTIPLRGQRLTLSFWVRGSKSDFAGNAYGFESGTAEANPGVGNGLTGAVSLATGTVAVTTSWRKVVLTSTGTVANNAALIRISLPRPTNFVNGDWIEYAGVQLEVGTAPSDYEVRLFGDELRQCQRYFERYSSAEGTSYPPQNPCNVDVANRPEVILQYQRKRTTPSITVSSGTGFTIESVTTSASATTTAYQGTLVGTGPVSANLFFTVASWTAFVPCILIINSSQFIDISAEIA